MMGTILVAGDLSWDTTLFVSRLPGPDEKVVASAMVEDAGGVGANAAVAAAQAGASVRFLCRGGGDATSLLAIQRMQRRGVDPSVDAGEGVLARAVTLVDGAGEKRLVLVPGVSMFASDAACGRVSLAGVAWVHLASYDAVAAGILARRCVAAGVPWSVDLEPASFPDGVEGLTSVLDGAAMVFCNDRAMAALGGEPAVVLPRMGVRSVVRTRGASGATLFEAGGATHVPAPAGAVVDTTGAGDCLAGWFVARRVAGDVPEAALRAAVAAATWSCGRAGAQSSFPSAADMGVSA